MTEVSDLAVSAEIEGLILFDVLEAALIEVDLRVVGAALISEFEVFFKKEAARTGLSVEVFDGLATFVFDGF